MRIRAGIAAAVVLAALAAAPAGAAEPYGLVASNANYVPGRTLAERTANYRRLYDAGVRAIRLDINWAQVEPAGPPLWDFDFRERDREVQAIRDAGLKVIGLLAYGHPDHAALPGAGFLPPDDPADFARYARATAEHYGDEVIAWEIYNEENSARFWAPREDPAAYARLLCDAYRAVKSADPGTPALYGGLFFPGSPVAGAASSGPAFLEATYRADPALGRSFDVLAYHPYAYPFTSPEVQVPVRGSLLSAARQLRAVLARHGDRSKPLWITEVGWPTSSRGYGVPEVKQAQYVARMQAATFAQHIPVLTWFTYGDDTDPSGLNQEAAFGFFRVDGTAKPSYTALRTFAQVFDGARFARDRSRALGLPRGEPISGGRGFALAYRRPDGTRITALWLAGESAFDGQGPFAASQPDRTTTVRVPVRTRTVTIVDYLGAQRTATARDGRVTLTIGPGPLYLVD